MKLYSKRTNGFYDENISDEIPDDAVEITDDKWMELLNGQGEGKVISAGENGYPVLTDPPPPSHEQLIAIAETEKKSRLDHAMYVTAMWRTELQLGIISDADKSRLTAWIGYHKAVQSVDTQSAPDIEWPSEPLSQ